MKVYRIFVINPGSTSTKLSLHENETCIFSMSVFHDSSVLRKFPTINDQLDYRMEVIHDFIQKNNIDLNGIDAIVGRGGGCYPVESGIYYIDDRLIEDTKNAVSGLYHASMLGVQMANELHKKYGGQMFMVDPPVVDEYDEIARITGVKGIYRKSQTHALNLKATVKKHAAFIGKKYEDCNFIACHIDGGISITAHRHGRMVDSNNAGGGEGPFTPTRMGGIAVTSIVDHFDELSREKLRDLCSQAGGLSSYFGTSNADTVHEMLENGDREAKLVWDAMIYQVCKYIGEMAVVLEGNVDGIILTGGLVRFKDVVEGIRQRCGWIGPISVYPGELEHEAMAGGALRVLRGEEEAKVYPGKPVWSGFGDLH